MNPSSQWPPDEPVVPATVIARLDELGYSAHTYELVAHTEHRALLNMPGGIALIALGDGSEYGSYRDLRSARAAFDLLAARDSEGDPQ